MATFVDINSPCGSSSVPVSLRAFPFLSSFLQQSFRVVSACIIYSSLQSCVNYFYYHHLLRVCPCFQLEKENYGDLKSALKKEPASHKHVHMSIGMSIADQSVSPSMTDTYLLHNEVPETSTGIAKVLRQLKQ